MTESGVPRSFALLLMALAAPAPPEPVFPPLAEGETPRAQLVRYLDTIGHRQLRERQQAVAQIVTRDQLEARRARVRETLLRLMGGLPERRTPLRARTTGRHQGPGFSVENVVFESLPGFPANLYRPAGRRPLSRHPRFHGTRRFREGRRASRARPGPQGLRGARLRSAGPGRAAAALTPSCALRARAGPPRSTGRPPPAPS